MSEVILFGDIEQTLVTAVAAAFTSRSETATVHKLVDIRDKRPAKYVTIERSGGSTPNLVTCSAQILVECHAGTEAAAYTLADLTHGIIHSLPGTNGIHRVTDVSTPARLPHPLSKAARYVFTVLVDYRGSAG